jgi:hypothetical protein
MVNLVSNSRLKKVGILIAMTKDADVARGLSTVISQGLLL